MTTRVRRSSMPRVPRVQDEEDNYWIENGFEDTDGSLSANENDGLDCRKRGPNHGTNVCADESGRILLTVEGNRFITILASCAVSANLKAHLEGYYPTSSLVPVDTKNFLWERFQHEKLGKPLLLHNYSNVYTIETKEKETS
ncbi:uncharacterized protein LOC111388822 [Olea europaea var. sylvestris]|uniref:uncharacterized protein LOC111388822 n=1 Tax=Olea europaea var. sylvestris TaxID=158386 RepID=UPI000C1D4C05|nr:uncharacterized protein LOC111388822 [Olea europaea var. sylvestris]